MRDRHSDAGRWFEAFEQLDRAAHEFAGLQHVWNDRAEQGVTGVVAGLKARLFAAVLVNFSPISVIG